MDVIADVVGSCRDVAVQRLYNNNHDKKQTACQTNYIKINIE